MDPLSSGWRLFLGIIIFFSCLLGYGGFTSRSQRGGEEYFLGVYIVVVILFCVFGMMYHMRADGIYREIQMTEEEKNKQIAIKEWSFWIITGCIILCPIIIWSKSQYYQYKLF